jgi:hypothetical protein
VAAAAFVPIATRLTDVRTARVVVPAVVMLLLPLLGGAVARPQSSLARLMDAATTSLALSTDTLAPPTTVAATGGTSVALTWTATVDTYAAGYDVLRGTVSGGPYGVVASVAPRSVVATTDSPGSSGTFHYVLRSTFQNWTSVLSNEASAMVTLVSTSTGFKPCTGAWNAADTGGDGNGYESNAANACASGGGVATDANTGTNTTLSCTDPGKDRHRYWDFDLGVPGAVATVAGIQVRAHIGMNNNAGTNRICAELSWDGGATWTAPQWTLVNGVGVRVYDLGAANDTWGRTWSGSDFSNTDFRVRLTDVSDRTNKDFRLDLLTVQVTYTP